MYRARDSLLTIPGFFPGLPRVVGTCCTSRTCVHEEDSMRINTCLSGAAQRDLGLIALAGLLVFILSVKLELSEALFAWTRRGERFQLDELMVLLLFFASASAWFAWRRGSESRREVARRIAVEAELNDALVRNRELARGALAVQVAG